MAKQKNQAQPEQTVPAPETTEQTNVSTDVAPATDTPPAMSEIESLIRKRDEAAVNVANAITSAKPQSEISQLMMIAYKSNKDVTDYENKQAAERAKIDAEREQQRIEAEYNEKLNVFVAAYNENERSLASLVNIPVGERTPEQIANANAATERLLALRNELLIALKASTGKKQIIHVAPQGMTGKQLERSGNGGGATNELIELMKQGKTNDEIEAMFPDRYPRTDKGLVHGTIRTARWKFNQMQKS